MPSYPTEDDAYFDDPDEVSDSIMWQYPWQPSLTFLGGKPGPGARVVARQEPKLPNVMGFDYHAGIELDPALPMPFVPERGGVRYESPFKDWKLAPVPAPRVKPLNLDQYQCIPKAWKPDTEKDNTMATNARTTELKNLENAAKYHAERAEAIVKRIEELVKQANVIPAEPGPGNYRIAVWFQTNGKRYEYLLKKLHDGRIFTTGTGNTGQFTSWAKFIEWLQNDTVANDPMCKLSDGGTVVLQSFEVQR